MKKTRPGAARPLISIVLPVYNEGENIEPALRLICEAVMTRPIEVLVVYDFDEDTTVPVVKRLRRELPQVRLHRNRLGRGVNNALKAGLADARAPYVVVTMADLSDDPTDIDRMYELAEGGADVVAGSRYMKGGRQVGGPLLKRTLSRTAGLSLHWVGGVRTHDSTNNFKLYSRRLLDQVQIESEAGFELAIELTVKAHLLGLRVAEVPTTWRDRTAGQSRFQMREWIPHYLRWYGRGLAGRFRARPR
jgi:glycosyltransferase involved in cell wall biosynthesis